VKDSFHGVELECYVQESNSLKGKDFFVHSNACSLFKERINSAFYVDDHKPEFPSKPYSNLKNLSDELCNIMLASSELAKKKNWVMILIGCHPYTDTFASGHIHSSFNMSPSKKEEAEIRRKLFSIQPLLALLSQNSPIMNGEISPVKDSRLAYGSWSQFTNYDEMSTGHYMALASGRKKATLECRIPSSCGLYQILGIVSFLKTIISFEDVPILPTQYVEDLYFKTLRYGGEAITPLVNPSKIGYLGFDGKTVYVKISDLWKRFLEDKETSSRLNEVLKELPPAIKKKVLGFYNIISMGLTASDFILNLFNEEKNKEEILLTLEETTNESYARKSAFYEILETPELPENPKHQCTISIKELEEMLRKEQFFEIQDELGIDKELMDYILNTHKLSLRKNPQTREFIKCLLRSKKPVKISIKHDLNDFLIENDIININDAGLYSKGKNFSTLLQLAKDEFLL